MTDTSLTPASQPAGPPAPAAPAAADEHPDALFAALDERDKQLYDKLLLNRYFSGTVVAVNYAARPFEVTVQIDGDTSVTPGTFKIGGTWYYPRINDPVEMVWRDNSKAWVAWPRIASGRTASRMYRTAAVIPSGWATIGMDTIDTSIGDNLDIAHPTGVQGYIIKAPGTYRVTGRAGATVAGFIVALGLNGAVVRLGHLVGLGAAGSNGGLASGQLRCKAEDLIQLQVFTSSAVALDTGPEQCYLEIEWVP